MSAGNPFHISFNMVCIPVVLTCAHAGDLLVFIRRSTLIFNEL